MGWKFRKHHVKKNAHYLYGKLSFGSNYLDLESKCWVFLNFGDFFATIDTILFMKLNKIGTRSTTGLIPKIDKLKLDADWAHILIVFTLLYKNCYTYHLISFSIRTSNDTQAPSHSNVRSSLFEHYFRSLQCTFQCELITW